MKFWKVFRWVASILFVLMVILAMLGAERNGSAEAPSELRLAPTIVR
jgi:hypothetical protein